MIPKNILEKVQYIEIKTRSIVNDLLSGEYHSVFKGQGMEFSEVRNYMEGDDIRTIDWNVTARTGQPFVKKYVEEREQTLMLMVDASASGNFASIRQMKASLAVELCALFAFSAIKNNDRVGLIIFTDIVEKYIPPKKGKNHVLRVIRELLYFEPANKGTKILEALTFLSRVQRKKAIVFMVSDFMDNINESSMRLAAKKHDMIAVTIYDPVELELPDVGFIQMRDAETGELILVNTGSKAFRAKYAKESASVRARLKALFGSANIDQIEISTAGDYIEPLVRFFKKREKLLAHA